MITTPSLDRWDIEPLHHIEWMPWGSDGNARAQLLAVADGFHAMLVEAHAGHCGGAHVQTSPEFLYLVAGTLRNQGRKMSDGDVHAAAGPMNSDSAAQVAATYVPISKICD